jgi:hypothetical protein
MLETVPNQSDVLLRFPQQRGLLAQALGILIQAEPKQAPEPGS